MIVTIHYDFSDGTEISHLEGLVMEKMGHSFNTHDITFFSNDTQADDVIVKTEEGHILSRKKLMTKGDNTYTNKEMRESHNLCKMLMAGSFKWR